MVPHGYKQKREFEHIRPESYFIGLNQENKQFLGGIPDSAVYEAACTLEVNLLTIRGKKITG